MDRTVPAVTRTVRGTVTGASVLPTACYRTASQQASRRGITLGSCHAVTSSSRAPKPALSASAPRVRKG